MNIRRYFMWLLLTALSMPNVMAEGDGGKDKDKMMDELRSLSARFYVATENIDSAQAFSMCDSMEYYYNELFGDKDLSRANAQYCRVYYCLVTKRFVKAKKLFGDMKDYNRTDPAIATCFYTAWMNYVAFMRMENRVYEAFDECRQMRRYALERKDDFGLAYSYMITGDCFSYSTDVAMDNYKKSHDLFVKLKMQRMVIDTQFMMANKNVEQKRWKEAIAMADEMLKSEGIVEYQIDRANMVLMRGYVNTGRNDKARKLFGKLDKRYKENKMNGQISQQWFISASHYLCKSGDAHLAPEYIEQVASKEDKLILRKMFYDAIDDKETALEYSDSLIDYREKMYAEFEKSQVDGSNAAFDNQVLQLQKQQMEIDQAKTQAQRNLIIIIALCVIILLRLYFMYVHKRLNKKLDMEKKTNEALRDAKTKMDAELGVAQRIQKNMLPQPISAVIPISVNAFMTPAKEVGGDFYNYLVSGNRFYFVIADVSGKGVPAALFMSRATELFSIVAPGEDDPAEIVTKINDQLCRDNEEMMFVTMIVGILDIDKGELQLCNAGHNPAYIGVEQLSLSKNIPVGLMDGYAYKTDTMPFAKGSRLVLYTDGVTEAENEAHEQFGEERLEEVLKSKPSDICEAVVHAVRDFTNGFDQSDDITIMSVELF